MRRIIAGMAALLMLLAAAAALSEEAAPEELQVHFLALGRMDGIFLSCGGESAFIDAGTAAGGEKSVRYLQKLNISTLKYYIGTHAHKDHVGGAAKLIKAFSPEQVYLPYEAVKKAMLNYAENSSERSAVRDARYAVLSPGDSLTLGGAVIDCLGPLKISNNGFSAVSENNNSLVLKLTLGKISFLLTADTKDGILKDIEKRSPGVLKCSVMKNPHHNGELDMGTVKLAAPDYMVFTTDRSHVPLKTYAADLVKAGIRLYSTAGDDAETVVFTTDGEKLSVSCSRDYKSIELKKADFLMKIGEKGKINPVLTPQKRYGQLYWTSSDESVARVSQSGVVRAVGPGETIITMRSDGEVSAQARVRVQDAEGLVPTPTPAAQPRTEEEVQGPVLQSAA